MALLYGTVAMDIEQYRTHLLWAVSLIRQSVGCGNLKQLNWGPIYIQIGQKCFTLIEEGGSEPANERDEFHYQGENERDVASQQVSPLADVLLQPTRPVKRLF